MTLSEYHKLVRKLRDIAVRSTAIENEQPISAGQLSIAEDLVKHSPTTVGQIAMRTGVSQSLVSKTVVFMQRANLITVTIPNEDKRKSLVSIRQQAFLELIRQHGNVHIETILRRSHPELTNEQLKKLESLLMEINELLG